MTPNDEHISIQPDSNPTFAVKLWHADPTDDIEASMTVAAVRTGLVGELGRPR